jgi:hypothetical protein
VTRQLVSPIRPNFLLSKNYFYGSLPIKSIYASLLESAYAQSACTAVITPECLVVIYKFVPNLDHKAWALTIQVHAQERVQDWLYTVSFLHGYIINKISNHQLFYSGLALPEGSCQSV